MTLRFKTPIIATHQYGFGVCDLRLQLQHMVVCGSIYETKI